MLAVLSAVYIVVTLGMEITDTHTHTVDKTSIYDAVADDSLRAGLNAVSTQ